MSGAGTVPFIPIAFDGRPSIIIVCRAIRSVMSLPDNVGKGAVMPDETD
jgi:hypothetical protein